MRLFGLIGFPLSHSFSAGYFAKKFKNENISDAKYINFPIDSITKLPEIIRENPDLIGLNITIPYKQQVIPYLSNLSDGAKEIGAINTIRINRANNQIELTGYNTDEYGFRQPLLLLLKPIHKKALILGSGGASKAVEFVLKSLNIDYLIVSRNPQDEKHLSYLSINESIIKNHLLIINTSPLGMYPNVNEAPNIPYHLLTSDHILYDLVYNPTETIFMQKGKEIGAIAINGLEMLHLQAEKAWEIWNS